MRGPEIGPRTASNAQQVGEGVDIQGNRRLRDEDLLYYIKRGRVMFMTAAALERDLRELPFLKFFR